MSKSRILITGANRGLGLELSRVFLENGWSVEAACRSSSAALEALQSGGSLQIHRVDLVDDASLEELAAALGDDPLDVLLNNAGTMGWKSFADAGMAAGAFGTFNREEWAQVMDINVFTPMKLSELLVDRIAAAERGRIVTFSSIVSSMTINKVGGMYGYRASKAAVNAIMRSMAIDLAKRGIIATAMHPGFARTDMGGPNAHIEPEESARGVFQVIDRLEPDDAGKLIAWNGDVLPW